MVPESGSSLSLDTAVALAVEAPSLQIGREVGRSRVVAYLGRGGVGEVHELEHIAPD